MPRSAITFLADKIRKRFTLLVLRQTKENGESEKYNLTDKDKAREKPQM